METTRARDHSVEARPNLRNRPACAPSPLASAIIIQSRSRWSHAAARLEDIRLSPRSEEHTSELQSLLRISYAVFRLITKKHIQPQTFRPPDTKTQSLSRNLIEHNTQSITTS